MTNEIRNFNSSRSSRERGIYFMAHHVRAFLFAAYGGWVGGDESGKRKKDADKKTSAAAEVQSKHNKLH